MVRTLPEPTAVGGSVPTLRGPIVIDGAAMVGDAAAPRLGQHTDDVMSDPEWGFDPRTDRA